MPPKAKFSKEEIIDAALAVVKEKGLPALTARALADKLVSSARPIFTVFQSMEEVQQAVLERARAQYKKYVEKGLSAPIAFKGVGTQYILFAMQEPKLFQLLFMTEQECVPDLDGALPLLEESYEKILLSITEKYKIDRSAAERLYQHLWIYTHGIAVLCATNMCRFTAEEISRRMTEVFTGLIKK